MRWVAMAAIVLSAISLSTWTGLAGQRAGTPPAVPPAAALPGFVMETAKGTIEIELFAADAPKSVEHLLVLFRRGFYRGLRFHRVETSLVQIGDPLTRDMSRQAYWGSGNSGNPIGVAEISKRHTHVRGTVALGHGGDARYADSHIYIMKRASPSLDGKHTIVGRVVRGMAVVDKLEVTERVVNAYVRGEGPK